MQVVEYLVISQRSSEFSTGFNPNKLGTVLNTYAELGWRVISSSVSIIPKGTDYFTAALIILERVVYVDDSEA